MAARRAWKDRSRELSPAEGSGLAADPPNLDRFWTDSTATAGQADLIKHQAEKCFGGAGDGLAVRMLNTKYYTRWIEIDYHGVIVEREGSRLCRRSKTLDGFVHVLFLSSGRR